MPATRSRSDRWREYLESIRDRRGAIELTADKSAGGGEGEGSQGATSDPDLVWRVRLHDLSEDTIVCERPGALGSRLDLSKGTALVGMMSVGQNRWLFRTTVAGTMEVEDRGRKETRLVLAMPDRVERLRRRQHERVATTELNLPRVTVAEILEPASAAAAEAASRVQIESLEAAGSALGPDDPTRLEIEPALGPTFDAVLVNIGGGGVGLRIPAGTTSRFDGPKLYWLELDLRPTIPAPLRVAARLAHAQLDSMQNTLAGMAFDFTRGPQHKAFVVSRILSFARRAAA